VTWGEVIRALKAAGYVEYRIGKGSHLHLVHQESGRVVTVSVHTKKDAGRLGNREAGIK
jgi:predicted RNA binding protein YcfA (HicA-like mRNA interferase family)